MSIQRPKKIPIESGIYIFRYRKTPIYIGKAANLKKRLASYWRKNYSEKVRLMMKEAELIKKYHPKYNILMRDDKHYFYVGITREEFPRIFITHQPQTSIKYPVSSIKDKNRPLNTKYLILNTKYVGPFTSGTALHSTLRLLRRIFPYCICEINHKRPCLNSQIGRCPGCCCIQENVATNKRPLVSCNIQYRENIKNIIAVLEGRRRKILAELKREMRSAAKRHKFEEAAKLRDQIAGLKNIFEHRRPLEARLPRGSRTSTTVRWRKIEQILQSLLGTKNKISRVEGYDISNISGTDATGSMVVFINGVPAKSEYRKFKVKSVTGANDIAMHKEVMRRRLAHPEWQYPDLMVIDGGKAQLNAAIIAMTDRPKTLNTGCFSVQHPVLTDSFRTVCKHILLVALAKREEELYIERKSTPIRLKKMPPEVMHFFQHIRDESHRFAKKYHHKLREIKYREKIV